MSISISQSLDALQNYCYKQKLEQTKQHFLQNFVIRCILELSEKSEKYSHEVQFATKHCHAVHIFTDSALSCNSVEHIKLGCQHAEEWSQFAQYYREKERYTTYIINVIDDIRTHLIKDREISPVRFVTWYKSLKENREHLGI